MEDQANTAYDGPPGRLSRLQSDPSLRLMLGFGAFVLAVVMLAGFYVVIQQGVVRGQTQWAKATRVVAVCDSDRTGGRDCLSSAASVKILQVSIVR